MEKPDPLLTEALAALRSGRGAAAEAICRTLVRDRPDHAPALHLLGVIEAQRGRPDLGIEHIGRAIALHDRSPEFHNSMGNALLARGRPADAANHYRRALELMPGHKEACFNLGSVQKELGKLDDAEALFRRALALSPDDPEARLNLGVVLASRGRFADAAQNFEELLARFPQFADARVNLANVLAEMGRLVDAERTYRRALEIDPDHAPTHDGLGHVLKQQGRLDEAIEAYRTAVALDPRSARKRVHLGLALADAGRFDEARHEAEKARESIEEDEFPHYWLGTLLARCGQRNAAREAFSAYLMRDPEDPLGARMGLAALGYLEPPDRTPQPVLDGLYVAKAAWWDRTNETSATYVGAHAVILAFQSVVGAPQGLDLLDAGCGAGLLGTLLPGCRLDGVDLSPALVDLARRSGNYRRVQHADLVRYMTNHAERYDVVLASAVLVHFGELHPVFEASAAALRDHGVFAFSVFENVADEDKVAVGSFELGLAQTGCYVHGSSYLLRVAEAHGFAVQSLERGVVDHFEGRPRPGLIATFRRQARAERQ